MTGRWTLQPITLRCRVHVVRLGQALGLSTLWPSDLSLPGRSVNLFVMRRHYINIDYLTCRDVTQRRGHCHRGLVVGLVIERITDLPLSSPATSTDQPDSYSQSSLPRFKTHQAISVRLIRSILLRQSPRRPDIASLAPATEILLVDDRSSSLGNCIRSR